MMMRYLSVILLVILVGCSPGREELAAADTLAEEGNILAALESYNAIIQTYPDTRTSRSAVASRRALKWNFIRELDEKGKTEPQQLLELYLGFAVSEADSPEAKIASERAAELEQAIAAEKERLRLEAERIEKERLACVSARRAGTKDAWRALLAEYPEHACREEAERRIAMRDATSSEKAQLKRYRDRCLSIKRSCTKMGKRYMRLMETGRWSEAERLMQRLVNVEALKSFGPRTDGEKYLEKLKADKVDTESMEKQLSDDCAVLSGL